MSRAFLKEDDGWNYCVFKSEACVFADENGVCTRSCCKDGGPNEHKKDGAAPDHR